MAKAKAQGNTRMATGEPAGLWHQPALMNLLADLLVVLASASLAWSALAAVQRLPLFPLRELQLLQLPEHVQLAQIEHTARTAIRGNFFTVDLDAARAAFEQLPWVRKAAVSRHWPDGLALTLEEHRPAGRWRALSAAESGGPMWLVNHQGEVFAAEAYAGLQALPQLAGPTGSAAEVLGRHGEFSTVLAPTERRLAALTLSTRQAWQLELDDGLRVELGREQERHPLSERLARFVEQYAFIAALPAVVGRVRHVDMRYPNGLAIGGIALAGKNQTPPIKAARTARPAQPPRPARQERKT